MLGPEGGCADALGDGSTEDIVREEVGADVDSGGSAVGVADARLVYAKARKTVATIALP